MDATHDSYGIDTRREKLLPTFEALLAIEATDLKSALDQAANLLVDALGAEKVDVSLHEPETDTLVAMGISDTAMGRRQQQIGMDRLQVANGGRVVEVYQTGEPYITGQADEDPMVLLGFTRGLGIRSFIVVPMNVAGERRGVLQAASPRTDAFTSEDLAFLQAVAHWVGMVAHRGELVERIAHDAAETARRAAAEELVTVLAHDLRNHLTPLRARVDLIHRRAGRLGDAKLLGHAEEAQLALSRLRRMISAMLDVARLDQGLFALSRQPVDLANLAHDTAAMLGVRDVVVEVRAPEELVVQADPDALRQALENLVANALKHSPGDVPVTLEVSEEETRGGRRAVVELRDRGPGIAPELMPRLFERFASGPGSEGLGLGLYLARGIAEAHGGVLTVDSKPGRGATFRLSLPLDGAA
ncbi:MAG: GAF domain-containing sensor histidine kinase [Chloroflexota bacterium]|nr:GAF domain-containing sensor histidine kinase [Chloroflexota bacterium]